VSVNLTLAKTRAAIKEEMESITCLPTSHQENRYYVINQRQPWSRICVHKRALS